MAVTGVTEYPQIVEWGNAREVRDVYTTGGVDSIVAGDLIRINAVGAIDLAEAASAGAVHGIALEADGGSATQIGVVLFGTDTIIKIHCIDGTAPSDLVIGDAYTIEVTAGSPAAITETNGATGVALVVKYAGTSQPWDDATGTYDEYPTATDGDNNSVHVRILSTILDAVASAAS